MSCSNHRLCRFLRMFLLLRLVLRLFAFSLRYQLHFISCLMGTVKTANSMGTNHGLQTQIIQGEKGWMNIEDDYDAYFKVIVVGDAGTGKTNIIQTFDKGVTPNFTSPTVGVDYFAKTMSVDPTHKVKMQIWDTAGQEQYRSIIKSHYKNAAGALVVFDVTNRYSFDAVRGWIYEVRERADEHVVVGVVGNKCDLNSRSVSRQEGEDLANHEHAFYMETSIHYIQSLRNAFERTAQEIYRASRSKNLDFSRGSVPVNNKSTGGSEGCSC